MSTAQDRSSPTASVNPLPSSASYLSRSSASLEQESGDIISAIVYDGHPNRDEDGRRTSNHNNANMDTASSGSEERHALAPFLRDHYLPHPPANRKHHLKIRVHAVGLNPVDAKDVVGDKLPHSWTWIKTRIVRHKLLHHRVMGFDFSGVVAEAHPLWGEQFPKGTKVMGTMPPLHGSCAEYLSAPVDQLCGMPSNYGFLQAAALPLSGLTALQSLQPHLQQPSAGSKSVLIIGASGGTGHVAVQVARNLGAAHITAVCSARSQAFVQGLGATHVVDYDGAKDMATALRQAPGCPFDVVLDCVTSADPRDQQQDYPTLLRKNNDNNHNNNTNLVSEHHAYLRLGGKSPDWIRAGMERVLGVQFQWQDKREKLFWIRLPNSADELRQLKEWAEQDRLRVKIAKTVPFTAHAVQGAMEELLERRVQGKLVVQVVAPGQDEEEEQGGEDDVVAAGGE